MKIEYYLSILLVLLLILNSCSDSNESFSVRTDVDEIKIWVEHEDSVRVFSVSNSLSVHSDDEQIATAYIKNNNVIIIKAQEKPSYTTLRIKEEGIEKAQVIVRIQSLIGGWKETEIGHFNCEALVDAEDKELKEILTHELWESAERKKQTIWGFSRNGDLTIVNQANERLSGTYDYKNGRLSVKYNNNSEQYKITVLNFRFLQIQQDLTGIYKEKYPNASINKVIVNRYLEFFTY